MASKKTPKKKKPSKADVRQKKLAEIVAEAREKRAENKSMIAELRADPGLADDFKKLLCEDLKRVSEIPREILGPSASRQRYRELGHYSPTLATYLFGMWAEFKRQAKIEPSLATRQVERNISKTTRAQDVANYADEFVKPWDGAYNRLDTSKPFTMMIGSDFHSRFCNPFARRVWHEVNEMIKPEAIRYNGDLVDFPSLSTHRQLPGHFPLNVQEEIDWAVGFMEEDRALNPKADIKLVMGNHDIRLVTALADKSPVFASLRSLSFANLFELDKLHVGLVCRSNFLNPSARHRKVDIAQNWETLFAPDGRALWTTVHGFLCGKDAPRKHLQRFMTHGTNGHLHDRQLVSGGSYATGVKHWYQTGCMAHPQAIASGYISGPAEFNAWSCGFLVVTIFPDTGHVCGEFVEVGEEVATFRGESWHINVYERDAINEMHEV